MNKGVAAGALFGLTLLWTGGAAASPSDVGLPLNELCGSPSSALAGVYHPYRLQVIKPCAYVTGTVVDVRREADGDFHIRLQLDPAYVEAITEGNVRHEHGDLVAEIIPADQRYEATPANGEHILIVGPYVIDSKHGWAEIHPVRYWIVLRRWAGECTPSNSEAARVGRC